MINDLFFIFSSSADSISGEMLNSVYSFRNFTYSSNLISISVALKFLDRLGGVSSRTFGGIESFGPPVGCCILAQPGRKEEKMTNISEKPIMLFKPIFERFKRFLMVLISDVIFFIFFVLMRLE